MTLGFRVHIVSMHIPCKAWQKNENKTCLEANREGKMHEDHHLRVRIRVRVRVRA